MLEKWRLTPLSEILTRVRNPVSVDLDTSYRQIGIRSHGKGIFHKECKTGKELGDKSVFWIEPECFVVNIVFAWEQAVAKTTINETGMIASHRFPIYKPKDNRLSINYLLHFFKTSKGKYLLELASPGGAGRNKTLGQAEFLKLEIPLPPLAEQLKIVEILGVWDESIDLLEKLITAKRKLKKGLMQQLLTGKRRFKRFDGSDWKKISIGEIACVDKKSLGNNTPRDYSFLYISLSDVENGTISANLQNLYFSEAPSRARRLVMDNDILMATVRPNLKSFAMVRNNADRYVVSTGFAVITTRKDYSPNYLYQYIFSDHIEKQINALVTGSNYPAINSTEIKGLIVNCPSLEEQDKIASVLSAADAEISTLEKQLAAYKQQKRGLMQQLLTGRTRILGLEDGQD
jgi:type I restriction enzyme, S subunit